MKRLKSLTSLATLILITHSACATERMRAISTDIMSWARLCTMNIGIHSTTGEHTSAECFIEYNPFEFSAGDSDALRLRCFTPQIALSYWPRSPFNGFYAKCKALWSVYNAAGITEGSFPEGALAGIGISAGWCCRLNARLALSAGIGTISYYHKTTYYAGARCGRILDHQEGAGVFPLDCSISVICLIHR